LELRKLKHVWGGLGGHVGGDRVKKDHHISHSGNKKKNVGRNRGSATRFFVGKRNGGVKNGLRGGSKRRWKVERQFLKKTMRSRGMKVGAPRGTKNDDTGCEDRNRFGKPRESSSKKEIEAELGEPSKKEIPHASTRCKEMEMEKGRVQLKKSPFSLHRDLLLAQSRRKKSAGIGVI